MGLARWFNDFNTNISVTNDEKCVTSHRYESITKRLNEEYWDWSNDSAFSLYVGSYGRNTAITQYSDIDMIFQLPDHIYSTYNNYLSNGQSALLQHVKNSISKTYPTTNIKGDGQIIQVTFHDNKKFEVLPAFKNSDGSYKYPDSNNGGRWCNTDPLSEIKAIKSRDIICNRNLIPLCKMMRAWKLKHFVPISGLLIDTLAYQFISNWDHSNKSYLYYDYLSRDFFKWMAEQNREQTFWRAPGSFSNVYGQGLFQYKANQCYKIALEAIEHETANPKREWSAKQKWREIYGTKFPN